MRSYSSFLVRTDPALTGNVKIVSNGREIFLESFNANSFLEDVRLKGFKINDEETYDKALLKYLKNREILTFFDSVKDDGEAISANTDYKFQYETMYWAGASTIEDKMFKEKFDFFAPLYLSIKKIPKGFFVFRTDGVFLNETPKDFLDEVVKEWKVVKFFSLEEKTPMGDFIRRTYDTIDIPRASFFINFFENNFSNINGIDLKIGGFQTKSFILDNEKLFGMSIFEGDCYLTKMFKSNSIVHPYIWNIKWIFDDYPSTPLKVRRWSMNTYHGFYVDELELLYTFYIKDVSISDYSIFGDFLISFPTNVHLEENCSHVLWLNGVYYSCFMKSGDILVKSDSNIKKENDILYEKKGGKTFSREIKENEEIKIYKIHFTAVEDIDMEFMDTKFSKFEYLVKDKYTETREPKFYLTLNEKNVYSDGQMLPDTIHSVGYKKEDFRLNPKAIPVSSEYTSELDTFTINYNKLNDMWCKAQWVCKFGFLGSKNNGDYPYRFNISPLAGAFNRSTEINHFTTSRENRTLDWFYTLSSGGLWDFYTLHLDNNEDIYLDIERLNDLDYINNFFFKERKYTDGVENVFRWAEVINSDGTNEYTTILNGLKLSPVEVLQKDYFGNEMYDGSSFEGYKMTAVLTQRPKWKNGGGGIAVQSESLPKHIKEDSSEANYEVGCDIIRIEKYKMIIIWLWILIENREDGENYIPPKRLYMDSTVRDNYYNKEIWPELLDNGIKKPTEFEPEKLSAYAFIFSLNLNDNEIFYNGSLRYCDILPDGSYHYMDSKETSWRLIVKPYETISVPFENRKIIFKKDGKLQISYKLDNILSMKRSYQDNVPSLNIWEETIATYIEQIKNLPENLVLLNRYSGYYDIITSPINLWSAENTADGIRYSRWNTKLREWGYSTEWVWSKTNTEQLLGDDGIFYLNVIIDDIGYQYGKRKLFTTSWSKDFFYTTEKIILGLNDSHLRK